MKKTFRTHSHGCCRNVQKVWNVIKDFVNFQIQWKHVVIGFNSAQNNTIRMYNPFLSFSTNKIYKHKMYCRFDNTEETEQYLFYAVKEYVLTYSNVLGCMRKTDDGSFFSLFFKVNLKL